jgi:hypothetical protein
VRDQACALYVIGVEQAVTEMCRSVCNSDVRAGMTKVETITSAEARFDIDEVEPSQNA